MQQNDKCRPTARFDTNGASPGAQTEHTSTSCFVCAGVLTLTHPELKLNIPALVVLFVLMCWCPDFEFRGTYRLRRARALAVCQTHRRRLLSRVLERRTVYMYGPVAEELRMCGWGPCAREASVWEACCWYSGVINMS